MWQYIAPGLALAPLATVPGPQHLTPPHTPVAEARQTGPRSIEFCLLEKLTAGHRAQGAGRDYPNVADVGLLGLWIGQEATEG